MTSSFPTYRLWAFLLFMLSAKSVVAQKDADKLIPRPKQPVNNGVEENMRLRAKYYAGDSVALIWTPANSSLWMMKGVRGYTLDRITLGVQKNDTQRLTPQVIQPWSFEEFKTRFDKTDNFQIIAAQALYGKNLGPKEDPSVSDQNSGTGGLLAAYEAQQRRFFLASIALVSSKSAADALGQRFVDRSVTKEQVYIYRLISDGDTAFTTVSTNRPTEFPPIDYTAKAGDGIVQFSFPAEYFSDLYPRFRVERATDGSSSWVSQTQQAILSGRGVQRDSTVSPTISYTDSLPQNGTLYKYRLVGIDVFADDAAKANQVEVIGRDAVPPSPVQLDKPEVTTENFVKLTWRKPYLEPDLAGYRIVRSDNPEDGYTVISGAALFPKTATGFVDNQPLTTSMNFYKVIAVDNSGNEGSTFPFGAETVDSIPPSVPTALKGTIDSLGRVTIRWAKSPEADVLGYKIYSSNLPNSEFYLISKEPILTTGFHDSVSNGLLNGDIYYRIVAIDKKYNHSKASQTLRLLKPVKNPPTSPVIRDYAVKEGKVMVSWANSFSENVVEHRVLRSENGRDWQTIKSIDAPTIGKNDNYSQHIDTTAETGKTYFYTVEAVNSGQLTARDRPLSIDVFDDRPKANFDQFTAAVQATAVILNWQHPKKNGYLVRIYRSDNGKDYQIRREVAADPATWRDELSDQTGTFRYIIKALFDDGHESAFSKEVKVEMANVKN